MHVHYKYDLRLQFHGSCLHQNKYPLQGDDYNYHDSLVTHLIEGIGNWVSWKQNHLSSYLTLVCNVSLSRSEPAGRNREYDQQNNVEMTNNHDHSGMYETTFGVDGEIETYTSEKPVSKY